jgi:hypothetical protein
MIGGVLSIGILTAAVGLALDAGAAPDAAVKRSLAG